MNNLELIISNEPKGKSSFILRDGSFINLQENRVNIIGYASKEVYHCEFINYLHNKGIDDVNSLNMIQVNDGTYLYHNEEAYIRLNVVKPTIEQYDALLKWLDKMTLTSKKKYILVETKDKIIRYEFLNKVNKEGILPEDIIKEIKKLYEE